ncbi:MAG TPA: DUF6084 family protein [Acidimicrobiales bacterium]|nr:DUF6084 family protein [Acidimicrobiales bacterium]
MADLRFECIDVQPERYAAVPTLQFRLRLSEATGVAVHAVALRCQIRIEPQRRRYSEAEADRLLDLFGELARWGETLKPLQFASVSVMVPSFQGECDVALGVACTYDFEVAAAKYFHSLEEGEIPLLLLFSGTVFVHGETGFSVEQVPWHKESQYRLPVSVWHEMMDLYFPNTAWVRVRRETLDALQAFKSRAALPTWDDAFETLLRQGGRGVAR